MTVTMFDVPGVTAVEAAAARRLRRAAREARTDLLWVRTARERCLDALSGWIGGHARVHRDASRSALGRARLVELSLADLEDDARVLGWQLDDGPAVRSVARERIGRVVADPVVLHDVAAEGAAHRDVLQDSADRLHAAASGPLAVETAAAVAALRSLATELATLDDWLVRVANALAAADDAATLRLDLLAAGVSGPLPDLARRATPTDPSVWARLDVEAVADERLLALLRSPSLPTPARDRLTRALVGRWATTLSREATTMRARAAATANEAGLLDRLTDRVDERWFDRLDAVAETRSDEDDRAAELERLAAGLRALLALEHATLLDARPGVVGGPALPGSQPTVGPVLRAGEIAAPTVRVALGDPASADHLAVLVPGTATGVANHARTLADAQALHHALVARGPAGSSAAVVVELYDPPGDLVRAADPIYAAAAARELRDGLSALGRPSDGRTVLVGHSYGAVVAGRAAALGAPVDGLVALGGPGLGVTAIDGLGLPHDEVWAARADGDPIVLAGDVAAVARAVGFDEGSPLTAPTVAHGPDPAGARFGARPLPTNGAGGREARGHLDYLGPDTASLAAVAEVVVGRDPDRTARDR